jgi:hypothetical protein
VLGQNPKHEARNSKQAPNLNVQKLQTKSLLFWDLQAVKERRCRCFDFAVLGLPFVSDFVLRISSFDIPGRAG